MKTFILCLTFALLVTVTGNNVLAQSEEKTMTSAKFGLKMNYPSDWTFIPSAPEFQEYTPGIYDYTAIVPPGQATVGHFCPSLEVEINAQSLDCVTESPVHLGILAYRLQDGTTLKEFYEGNIKRGEQMKDLSGSPKYIQASKINISGVSAIETISTSGGGGSLGKLLNQLGQTSPTSKDIKISVVNGNTGYEFSGGTEDQKEFDTYLPTLQKIMNSIQIQGAMENPENTMFVPEAVTSSSEEATTSNTSEDLVLLSHKLKKGEGDYNDIIGQVKNIGSDTLEFVKIGISVYDKNGDIVGTDSTYAESSTLEPNQKSSFDILSPKDNFDGMDSYELSLSWQTPDGSDKYVDNAPIYKEKSEGEPN